MVREKESGGQMVRVTQPKSASPDCSQLKRNTQLVNAQHVNVQHVNVQQVNVQPVNVHLVNVQQVNAQHVNVQRVNVQQVIPRQKLQAMFMSSSARAKVRGHMVRLKARIPRRFPYQECGRNV